MLFPLRSKRNMALALGGGAAHGLAHIGVLEVLEERGINIALVTGTSVGAIIGAIWAAGYSAGDIAEIASKIRRSDILRLTFPDKGLFSIKGIRKIIREFIPHDSFEGLKRKFGCVATDLNSGEPEYIVKGELSRAIAASCAIPAVFKPVKIGERFYVDGGLCENVPAVMARKMGATAVIGVALNNHYEFPDEPDNIFEIMAHSIYLMGRRVKRQSDEGDVIISPRIESRDYAGLDNLEEYIQLGRYAAEEMVKYLKSPIIRRRREL